MTKPTLIGDLETFRSKAGCMHTQGRAEQLWRRIVLYLTDEERSAVRVAWSHHVLCGEGRGELDRVCNDLIAKLRAEGES